MIPVLPTKTNIDWLEKKNNHLKMVSPIKNGGFPLSCWFCFFFWGGGGNCKNPWLFLTFLATTRIHKRVGSETYVELDVCYEDMGAVLLEGP